MDESLETNGTIRLACLSIDAASANSVTAGRKVVRGIESNQVPNVEDLLDQVLSELATLGLDASLLR